MQTRIYQVVDNNTEKTESQAGNTHICVSKRTDIANADKGNEILETISETSYFRGENLNNWVKFDEVTGDDATWRIISIENGIIKVVRNTPPLENMEWDVFETYGTLEWERAADINTYLNGEYNFSHSAFFLFQIGQIMGKYNKNIFIPQYGN